jgi:CheY-like chemotaxis protein
MRALVVDNSKGLRVLLGWILQEVGLETVEASNGTEALQILGTDERFAVVISGRPHSSDAEYALRSGVNDYVIKPFTREAILHGLTRMGVVRS